ncbi:multidrug effflux MFS transporter [Photobacterium chitinilyticum]|uniref:MFS transporter n=1 Tax=Photobacterium chitinilyticum TaxID=2485123 RepID=A0A3S3UID9_9GAMM|nr:multidrug effflux MFS transporter [Photobacterium chitinilyticum]RWX54684.1 MFS transporter [Photobacterium chitinilyticum]
MKAKPSLGLMVVLIMFPQIVETIYSPVLPHIAAQFVVSIKAASQTLSIYFLAFALGVIVWGVVADRIGRRKTMLLGLSIYAASAAGAVLAPNFEALMFARGVSAFGIAVGSVVTQTMLRDSYDGTALSKVFSYMGMGISISPVVGMMSGGFLADWGGHSYVFFTLSGLALVLLIVSILKLPETMPANTQASALSDLFQQMIRDRGIWRNALLVAAFNILLFSYYLQGPFLFEQLGYSSIQFGRSGVVLAIGTFAGSLLNKRLVQHGFTHPKLLALASILGLFGAVGVLLLQGSLWFLIPMVLVVMGFGIGIPNVLSQALVNYRSQAGSAGAVLGLLYYLMIGGGLAIAGAVQNLGVVLVVCAVVALVTVAVSVRAGAKP